MYKNKNIISEHAPKAKKPFTDSEFGSFLAGLIDGGGHISKQGHLLILFHEKDVSVAYYLKKMLNYGNIKKVEGYNAYNFKCVYSQGLAKITRLILDKLKQPKRIKQFNNYLIKIGAKSTKPNTDCLLKNYWLAGFIQADGSFVIKTIRRLNKIESQIVVQIDQRDDFLLKQIQHTFSGYIGCREPWESYYYSSLRFLNAIKLINYLDNYQVMGATLTAYWLWRKAYLILQNSKHLEHTGIYKYIRLKKSLTVLGP
jgi:LAGLIDADG endonuclease